MKELRPYQRDAVDSICNYFNFKNGNPVIAAPTGSGKSLIIAFFVKEVIEKYPNQRIMIVTHVKELVSQNCEELLGIFPDSNAGIFSAGLNRKEISQITFATIGSVVKVPEKFGCVNYLLIDEVHMADTTRETMYKKFIDGLKVANPNLKVIGLSATPYRLGQGLIIDDGIFTDICFDNTKLEAFNYLLEEGYLDYLVTKKTLMQLDVSGVRTIAGEFNQDELQKVVNTPQIIHTAISESLRYFENRHCIVVFAAGTDHSDNIAAMFNDEFGISAISIHSRMTDDERDTAIADFKAGKYRVAVNNIILGVGVNIPQIDMIIDLQPTESTARHVQKYGRGTRPVYAKGYDLSSKTGRLHAMKAGVKSRHCLVLDFAGNTYRNGAINDPIIPTKTGVSTSRKKSKTCKKCLTIHPIHKKICDTFDDLTGEICNYTFNEIEDPDLTVEASTEELIATASMPRIKKQKPIKKDFDVSKITYSSVLNQKDNVFMLAVKYHCGEHEFTEYVCLEHKGFLKTHANRWWEQRYKNLPKFIPNTIAEAIEKKDYLLIPVMIHIHLNAIPTQKIERYSFKN